MPKRFVQRLEMIQADHQHRPGAPGLPRQLDDLLFQMMTVWQVGGGIGQAHLVQRAVQLQQIQLGGDHRCDRFQQIDMVALDPLASAPRDPDDAVRIFASGQRHARQRRQPRLLKGLGPTRLTRQIRPERHVAVRQQLRHQVAFHRTEHRFVRLKQVTVRAAVE